MDSKHTNDNHENNGLRGRIPYDFLDEGPTLKDYLPVIWRGKWIILACMLIALNIALFNTMSEEPEYRASVSVFVNTQGQKASLLGGLQVEESKNIGNELEMLRSRMVAESVAEQLMQDQYLDEDNEQPIPILTHFNEQERKIQRSSKNAVINRLRSAVSFTPRRESDFIAITARSTNNREAALIANTYAKVYHDRNFYLSRAQSRSVREFIEDQLAAKQNDLEQAEQQLKSYMERHGIVSMDDETKRVINQVSSLEARLGEIEVELKSLENVHASLQDQLEEHEPNIARNIGSADNAYIRMIQEQMAELEVERDLTLTQNPGAKDDERYRRMIAEIDEQLNDLRQNLERRTEQYMRSLSPGSETGPAGFVMQLKQRIIENDIQRQGLELKADAIEESLEKYERQFNELPQVNLEYARLQRTRNSAEQMYLMLERRYNEALITEQSEFGSVNIIDRAQVPSTPVGTNFSRNIILSLLLGAGLGIGLVIGREHWFGPVRIPEDLQKNNFDVLTTVASMNQEVKKFSTNGKIEVDGKKLDNMLIMIGNPLSPSAESYRLLRTNLQYTQIDKKINSLLVTSPSPGEGKTTTAANLAISYAQTGERALLIDCDLRKPALANDLHMATKPGITEMLTGDVSFDDAVQSTVVENLDFLATGVLPVNPSELLGSKKMKSLIESVSERYRIIILDSPPVLAASDPLVLSTITDGVLIVAASNKTRGKELELTRDSLTRIGSTIIGVVLNFFDYRQAYGSAYKYKYYRYGSYGYSANDKESGVR